MTQSHRRPGVGIRAWLHPTAAHALAVAFLISVLLGTFSSHGEILQGTELLQHFEFTQLQQTKLPRKLPDASDTASAKTKTVLSKLLAANSPVLRPSSWSYDKWVVEEVEASRKRGEAISAHAQQRASAYVTWLESKQLQPSSESGAQAEFLAAAAAAGDNVTTSANVITTPNNGGFYTLLQVGTPPQPAVVLVDTGSDLTWFQCKPCTQCFNQTRTDIFEPAKSSTYSTVSCVDATCQAVNNLNLCSAGTCQYSIVYLDRTSTTGPVSTDTMTTEPVQGGGTSGGAPAAHLDKFVFGCGTNQNFAHPLDIGSGVLGMGRRGLSLPLQLDVPGFAYCLPDRFTDQEPGTGYLYLGDTSALVQEEALKFVDTPMLSNPLLPTVHYIGVTGISVGGVAVDLPADALKLQANGTGGVLLDSGTTITILAGAVYDPVMAALESGTTGLPRFPELELATGMELCYTVSGGRLPEGLPSFAFHLEGGADWQLPLANYFIPAVVTRDGFCYAFASLGGNALSFSIIGNTQQQNTVLVHDWANNKVSFSTAATSCG